MTGSMVIAIDGPSGSGKSTTSRMLAERLGLAYLDTGAMYRAVAWLYLDRGLKPDDTDLIIDLARSIDMRIVTVPGQFQILVEGKDITEAIRAPEVSACVSVVATIPKVRDLLSRRMREIIAAHGQRIVLEGRDTTTVVAPDADVRVLLVADPKIRVARRSAELGDKVDQAAVTDQVIRRDRDDSTVSEFSKAADGVTLIDSTFLGPEEVVEQIIGLSKQ